MRKPVLNILGFALITTVLSVVALNSNWTGESANDQVSYLSDDTNEESEPNIASICSRINRLRDNTEGSEPKSAFSDSDTSSDSLRNDFDEPQLKESFAYDPTVSVYDPTDYPSDDHDNGPDNDYDTDRENDHDDDSKNAKDIVE